MKTLLIRPDAFLFSSVIWLSLFLVATTARFNYFQVLNIFGFITLILLPGLLTIVFFRLQLQSFWATLAIVIGFSILELVGIALIGNSLLPAIGIKRPLDATVLTAEFAICMSLLIAAAWRRMSIVEIHVRSYVIFDSARDAVLSLSSLLFMPVAIAGAFRLNNGTDGSLTLIMLLTMAIYLGVVVYLADTSGPEVIPTVLFSLALSLLLMNSLRGWYITGHDIQREFTVFQLSKNAGIWSIASYRDAYNACMSITILPTIFGNLLSLADPYVYKVLFQVIFASVIPVIFLTIRRYVSATIAFLAAIFFIAFPTFFQDMSFLDRQEIAFVFLGLMIFIIFEQSLSINVRRSLFLVFGIGMALSHYSTTYTVVAILIFLVYSQTIVALVGPRLRTFRWFKRSSVPAFNPVNAQLSTKPQITFWMVVALTAVSFVWSSVVTNTASGSIGSVVKATFFAINSNAQEDAKSSDVNASILTWQQTDPKTILQQYIYRVVDPAIFAAPEGIYYPITTYARYSINTAPDENVPLTSLGAFLFSQHIDVSTANYLFRQASAKLLQLLIVLGFALVLFSSRFLRRSFDMQFFLLAAGNLLMLGAIVTLPVLSVQYGILRAFQQSLMFLGLFIVIGCLGLLIRFGKTTGIIITTVLALLFFLSETGVFTQIFGGYNPQLNLNNSGLYYDLYYTHASDIAGIRWLIGETDGVTDNIQASTPSNLYSNAALNIAPTAGLSVFNDIFPALVRTNSYVYLGFATVHNDRAMVTYDGTIVTYAYPMQFLDDTKDLVYSNSDVKIYR